MAMAIGGMMTGLINFIVIPLAVGLIITNLIDMLLRDRTIRDLIESFESMKMDIMLYKSRSNYLSEINQELKRKLEARDGKDS